MKIYNVAVRKLKDGSFTGSFTIPAGVKRSEIVPYEDADEGGCELMLPGEAAQIKVDRPAEKLAFVMNELRGILRIVEPEDVHGEVEAS